MRVYYSCSGISLNFRWNRSPPFISQCQDGFGVPCADQNGRQLAAGTKQTPVGRVFCSKCSHYEVEHKGIENRVVITNSGRSETPSGLWRQTIVFARLERHNPAKPSGGKFPRVNSHCAQTTSNSWRRLLDNSVPLLTSGEDKWLVFPPLNDCALMHKHIYACISIIIVLPDVLINWLPPSCPLLIHIYKLVCNDSNVEN